MHCRARILYPASMLHRRLCRFGSTSGTFVANAVYFSSGGSGCDARFSLACCCHPAARLLAPFAPLGAIRMAGLFWHTAAAPLPRRRCSCAGWNRILFSLLHLITRALKYSRPIRMSSAPTTTSLQIRINSGVKSGVGSSLRTGTIPRTSFFSLTMHCAVAHLKPVRATFVSSAHQLGGRPSCHTSPYGADQLQCGLDRQRPIAPILSTYIPVSLTSSLHGPLVSMALVHCTMRSPHGRLRALACPFEAVLCRCRRGHVAVSDARPTHGETHALLTVHRIVPLKRTRLLAFSPSAGRAG